MAEVHGHTYDRIGKGMGIYPFDDTHIQPFLDVFCKILGDIAVVAPHVGVEFLVHAEASAQQDEELLPVRIYVVKVLREGLV